VSHQNLLRLLAVAGLIACGIGAEERVMLATFGDEYAAYAARTKRLLPGVW
jgi:protein-S-isoprenylcysteine O-methyltransferase Ste14